MPGSTALVQNQLTMLESGLKQLRNSKMKKQPEFKDMFIAIDSHHREVKLAHLTGKPSDVMQQSQQDTKFYYILARMLNEVNNAAHNEGHNLKQVYNWYLSNKHVLHTGPKFGKNKKKGGSNEPRSILKNCIGQLEKEALGIQMEVRESSKQKVEADVWEQEEDLLPLEEAEVVKRPQSSPLPRQVAATPNNATHPSLGPPQRAAQTDNLLPKRKIQPLAHLYNPHAPRDHSNDAKGENTGQVTMTSPVTLRVVPTAAGSTGQAVRKHSMASQRKWEMFQQSLSYGQDQLSKLQYVGRGGMPSGVRYSAHEHGLSAEEHTQDVITTYAMVDEMQKQEQGDTVQGDQRELLQQPLEQFYEKTDSYYPAKLPKYPSFKKENRTKSAPARSAKTPGFKDRQTPTQKIQSAMSRSVSSPMEGRVDSDIHLDTVVGLINNVTDELTFHKEKLAPDPYYGFRQPVMPLDPNERPQTAPSGGTIARPTTPDIVLKSLDHWVGSSSSSQNGGDILSGQCSVTSRPGTAQEAIDWRGQVTPNTAPYKYSHTAFNNHTFVKKTSSKGGHSSLRSAGSTHGGHRPKTAPQAPTERWSNTKVSDDNERVNQAASHTTTEIPTDAFSDLFNVFHLGGKSKRKSRFHFPLGYDFEMEKDMQSGSPNMEYLSIIAPLSRAGSRSTSAAKSTRADTVYTGDSAHPYSPFCPSTLATSHTLFGDPMTSIPQQPPGDDNSSVGELDVPDLHDLDDDLDDLSGSISACSDTEFAEPSSFPTEEATQNTHTAQPETSPEVPPPSPTVPATESQLEPESKPADVQIQETVKENVQTATDNIMDTAQFCQEVNQLVGDTSTSIANTDVLVPPAESQNITPLATKQSSKPKSMKKEMSISGIQFSEATIMHKVAGNGAHPVSSNIGLVKPHPLDKVNPAIKQSGKELPDLSREVGTPASTPRSPRHRIFAHSFPKSDSKSKPEVEPALSIDGRSSSKKENRARSAGSVPLRARSATRLQMIVRQQEMLRRSPSAALRTAPSIPSHYDAFGGRSSRGSNVYSAEMEAHARIDRSPRHFLEKVSDLRSQPAEDDSPQQPTTLPSLEVLPQPLTNSIRVSRLSRAGDRPTNASPCLAQGRPSTPVHLDEIERLAAMEFSEGVLPDGYVVPGVLSRVTVRYSDSPRNITDIGRPIPAYVEAKDPVEAGVAAEKLRQAKAAVDIQRIFRGYVARNSYKHLMTDERVRLETERMAAVNIQRTYRGHLARTRAIERRPPNQESLVWAQQYKEELKRRAAERCDKANARSHENMRNKGVAASKLSVIGPHVEVYQNFHPKPTGPNKKLLHEAAIVIQRMTRGLLVRASLHRLKRKAKLHAGSWGRFVAQYKELLRRIQGRMGIERPSCPVSFASLNAYMDVKKRYESVFDKRSFGGELELSELGAYFKECDIFPSPSEVDEAFDIVFRGQSLKKGRGLCKEDTLEITFQIYPPEGSGIVNPRMSTWMNPIVDGEEGQKLIGSEQVESTEFKTVWNLVARSRKTRNAQQNELDKIEKEEEWQKKHGRRQSVTQNPGGLHMITEESDAHNISKQKSV